MDTDFFEKILDFSIFLGKKRRDYMLIFAFFLWGEVGEFAEKNPTEKISVMCSTDGSGSPASHSSSEHVGIFTGSGSSISAAESLG